MVEKIVCEKCGYVLYESKELIPPLQVYEKYNGVCPNCKKKLNRKPLKIEIKINK